MIQYHDRGKKTQYIAFYASLNTKLIKEYCKHQHSQLTDVTEVMIEIDGEKFSMSVDELYNKLKS